MMQDYKRHLCEQNASLHKALEKLDFLAIDAILFVVDNQFKLLGSLTDGDIRRGFLNGLDLESPLVDFINKTPQFINKSAYSIEEIISLRNRQLKIIPVLDSENRIINVINFRFYESYLPIDVVIMAGGRGERLKPLTDHTPKPMLKVGGKPIIEHNIDRLARFGVDDFWISVRYLGDQIKDYFQMGENKNIRIKYLEEKIPLGTIGALSQISNFEHDVVLLTNSDLLTNLNYEDFYLKFKASDADLSIVAIPYEVSIPYAVLETDSQKVVNFKEKPTYTYLSSGGIYLMKKEVLKFIPENVLFNATDLIEKLIAEKKNVITYSFRGYWLDIGKHEDFERAQSDIIQLK